MVKCTINLFSTKEKQKKKTLAMFTAFSDPASCVKTTLFRAVLEAEGNITWG